MAEINWKTKLDECVVPKLYRYLENHENFKCLQCQLPAQLLALLDEENEKYLSIYNNKNTNFVILYEGDVDIAWTDKNIINQLSTVLSNNNNTLSLIMTAFDVTDIKDYYSLSHNIHLHVAPEVLGIYYTEHTITMPTVYDVTYDLLANRTSYDRLLFFVYFRYFLDNKGYLSYNHAHNPMYPINVIDLYNETSDLYNNLDTNIIGDFLDSIPYKNFIESETKLIQDIQKHSMLSVVIETYNNLYNLEYQTWGNWFCYTEKLMRSLQVPNATLLISPPNSNEFLKKYNFKMHGVNQIIERFDGSLPKAQLLVGLIEQNLIHVNIEEEYDAAIHNNSILKTWWDLIQTEEYYENIICKINTTL